MGSASRADIGTDLVFVGGCSRRWWLMRLGVHIPPPIAKSMGSDSIDFCLALEQLNKLHKTEDKPLPPPTFGRDLANKLQSVVAGREY